jgi:PIN domain nuclease of toxin-antitoxin system
MNILLDTHILLWHLTNDPRLEIRFSIIIEDSAYTKYLSIVSLWEMAVKISIGKLAVSQPIDRIIPGEINMLNLKIPHIVKVQDLAFHHRDPFDRMIIAQAISENMTVMTHDSHFRMYGVNLI